MTDDASGQSGQSNNKPSNNSNRRRRNNNKRRYNAKPNQSGEKKTNPNSTNTNRSNQNTGSANKNRNRNRNKNRNNKPRGPKLTGLDFIATKYLNLLDQHIIARKKYFDNFGRVNIQTRAKLEKNFIESQKALLEFKAKLKPEDLKLYESHFEALSDDTTYSINHGLEIESNKEKMLFEDSVFEDETKHEPPHYLQTQIESSYAEDAEESSGNIEDYKNYKGQS